jgi:hypothetical protein
LGSQRPRKFLELLVELPVMDLHPCVDSLHLLLEPRAGLAPALKFLFAPPPLLLRPPLRLVINGHFT